jgi:hypothetical protein
MKKKDIFNYFGTKLDKDNISINNLHSMSADELSFILNPMNTKKMPFLLGKFSELKTLLISHDFTELLHEIENNLYHFKSSDGTIYSFRDFQKFFKQSIPSSGETKFFMQSIGFNEPLDKKDIQVQSMDFNIINNNLDKISFFKNNHKINSIIKSGNFNALFFETSKNFCLIGIYYNEYNYKIKNAFYSCRNKELTFNQLYEIFPEKFLMSFSELSAYEFLNESKKIKLNSEELNLIEIYTF